MAYTKGYDIAFPLRDDATGSGGFFGLTTTLGQTVASKIMLLVTTRKGTRWRRPTYGCQQVHRLFDPNDTVTGEEIELDIRQSVEEWLPGVAVSAVTNTREKGVLILHIYFEYTEGALRKREVLSLPIA
jgi:phage baseplate assembly protein W